METRNAKFFELGENSGSKELRDVIIEEVRVDIPILTFSESVIVPPNDHFNDTAEQIHDDPSHNKNTTNEQAMEIPEQVILRRSHREQRPAISSDYVMYLQEYEFDIGMCNDPVTFSQAKERGDSDKWINAMKEELKSMTQNKV